MIWNKRLTIQESMGSTPGANLSEQGQEFRPGAGAVYASNSCNEYAQLSEYQGHWLNDTLQHCRFDLGLFLFSNGTRREGKRGRVGKTRMAWLDNKIAHFQSKINVTWGVW